MTGGVHTWKQRLPGLIISILLAEGVGLLSSFFTRNTMQEYQQLIRPSFSPPGWVFPVVWSILFLLMGIASYRVYEKGIERDDVKSALLFYGIQLVFNFFWPILFFGLGLQGFAFLWLIILWVLILITTVKFYNIDKIAGYLMIPYILWVSFAGALNYAIWQLNR